MTPYIKGKLQELINFMSVLSQRQRDIQKEISKEQDRQTKDILNNERTTNTVVLRCAGWIKMTLEGKSLKDKLLVDKTFPLWYKQTRGYYVHKPLADLWGWKLEKYTCGNRWPSAMWNWNMVYFNQRQLFYYIQGMLFPDKSPGIFGFQSDDDIENDVWRTTFRELDKKEWEEFKEMTKPLYF